ncbi:hypothetical protein KVR01_012675 [Diaporthe batatas]|uniref:uncharacterized protein n=1 Tax=Diaporthe batatas TaxID=748121 RepID=UPI001D045961|nr:uncharacterized protein KVR01_012675 [Diaporthe batatas]KAG8157633.1 hypothetical protein KVR01_012675 [Diaporthe batatas]
MRFTLALAALVAATSALPSLLQPAGKHALTTREDFVEDDFEIPAESDGPAKRSAGWPEDDFEIGVPAHLRFKDKKARDEGFPEDDFEITPEDDD